MKIKAIKLHLGYENLEAKSVVDLKNPPESKPVGEIMIKQASGKYVCSVCGYVYDPAEHDGVAFEDLPNGCVSKYIYGIELDIIECYYELKTIRKGG